MENIERAIKAALAKRGLESSLKDEQLRLQDTLFGVLWKIVTARSKSVRFSSNFHQMLASACKI